MKWFRELDIIQLFFLFLLTLYIGAGIGVIYQNYLDYQTKLHVLQCVEKTQNAELCNKVLQK